MFLFILTYQRPAEEVDAYLEAHKAYLDTYYRNGNFLVSGRRVPRTGGVILCKAGSREEADEMMRHDPFYIHGIATYEVIEFVPGKYAEGLEPFTT